MPFVKGQPARNKGIGKTLPWIMEHQNYPHKDWCLFWPFSRESRTGRAMIGIPVNGTKYPHRIMCELVNGPPPPDKPQAAHTCGTVIVAAKPASKCSNINFATIVDH